MTTQTVFDPKKPPPLSPREWDILRTLRTQIYLDTQEAIRKNQTEPKEEKRRENLEKAQCFTVDTLRMLGFDRFMPQDSKGRRNYGTMLHKWQIFGHTERTGRTVCSTLESNHGHREQVWKLKEKKQP